MTDSFIQDIHKALSEESIQNPLSGWIFTNFHNRDSLTDNLLSLSSNTVSTRRWIYIVLTDGTEIKILHEIEPHSLDCLPAAKEFTYSSQKELISILSELTAQHGTNFAILSDENISVISTVDAGFVSLLSRCGIVTVSAAPLIQRCKGLLTPAQIDSQERAGAILYSIVYETWKIISEKYNENETVTEYGIQQFIMSRLKDKHLITDHPPIVAFGAHSGNPHYEPTASESASACKGDIIQLDIWAKEMTPEAVYADISWVGFYGKDVPSDIQNCWTTLTKARDSVCLMINEAAQVSFQDKHENIRLVTGTFLDKGVRQILTDAGYEKGLKHRTGHGIDTECHGSGVNLDSVEFPDNRTLLEGSSFSVEPGLYFDKFGLRTEIDIYIKNREPVISGKKYTDCPLEIPQKDILTIF